MFPITPVRFGILSILSGTDENPHALTLMSDRRKEYDDHSRVTLDRLLLTQSAKVLDLSLNPPKSPEGVRTGLLDVFQTGLKPEDIRENGLQRYRLGLHAGKTSVALFRELFPILVKALEENRLSVRFDGPDILVEIADRPAPKTRTGILGRLLGK